MIIGVKNIENEIYDGSSPSIPEYAYYTLQYNNSNIYTIDYRLSYEY